jgi:hypothetical protein
MCRSRQGKLCAPKASCVSDDSELKNPLPVDCGRGMVRPGPGVCGFTRLTRRLQRDPGRGSAVSPSLPADSKETRAGGLRFHQAYPQTPRFFQSRAALASTLSRP